MATISNLPRQNTNPQSGDLMPIENPAGTAKITFADLFKTTSARLNALEGLGGYVNAFNFGLAMPTQEQLTQYTVSQIWTGYSNWSWDDANPSASTFTDADGVSRTVSQIFNATKVVNDFDNHVWVLTNTPTTDPVVFSWADGGINTVALATATEAGIMKLYAVLGTNTDGTISQDVIRQNFALYLLKQGGIMTGALTLSGNPTADLHAAPKQYVDSKLGGLIPNELAYTTFDYATIIQAPADLYLNCRISGFRAQRDEVQISSSPTMATYTVVGTGSTRVDDAWEGTVTAFVKQGQYFRVINGGYTGFRAEMWNRYILVG